jgi:N-methylhydantoinase A/oxoprolinase/acetone carboxylase beta subunit
LGGSSIVAVSDGAITIGPESVGASPGPACFGRGGTSATLTDALLVCGILDPDNYLGGELKLDRERAAHAILSAVGEPLGQDTDTAALTTIAAFERAVGENLANTVRGGGREPHETCLIAYGGGGPMIITGIAEAAGIKRVIIPRLASVFSAFGIGFSHLAHEYQTALNGADASAAAAELRARAERDMYGEGVAPEDCRYDVSLWGAKDGAVVEAPFADAASFGARVDEARVNLKAIFELPTAVLAADDGQRGAAAPSAGNTDVLVAGTTKTALPIYDDAALQAGHTIKGPGLLRGAYLTCLIREGWSLRVTKNLDLVIEAN